MDEPGRDSRRDVSMDEPGRDSRRDVGMDEPGLAGMTEKEVREPALVRPSLKWTPCDLGSRSVEDMP